MSAQFPCFDNIPPHLSLLPPPGGFSREDAFDLFTRYGDNPLFPSAGLFSWLHPIDRIGPDSPRPYERLPVGDPQFPDGGIYIPDFMYEAGKQGRMNSGTSPYYSQGRMLMNAMGVASPVPQERYGYEAVPAW